MYYTTIKTKTKNKTKNDRMVYLNEEITFNRFTQGKREKRMRR